MGCGGATVSQFTIEAVRDDGRRRRLTVPATGEPLLFDTRLAAQRRAGHLREILAPSDQHHITYEVVWWDTTPRRIPVGGDRVYHKPVGGLAEYGVVGEVSEDDSWAEVRWEDTGLTTRVGAPLLAENATGEWGYADEVGHE